MKVLLDTNIIIHREMLHPTEENIGRVFRWMDKLGYEKCVHAITINEISKMRNEKFRKSLLIKMESYHQLPTVAPLRPEIRAVSKKYDCSDNDLNDTLLLNEVFSDRVDLLITEDRKIHLKSSELGIDDKVFTIDEFLEKVTTENPELLDYKIPSIKKEYFGDINIKDKFFDSFKEDYKGFDIWFNKKSDEVAYVSTSDKNIVAFLYLKVENDSEPYSDIIPVFTPKKRLKIGTFKVHLNGFKLGERLLKIVFDNALNSSVDEIYVTIFRKREEQIRLINLLEDFGFRRWGIKKSSSGEEEVYVRDFSRKADVLSPKLTYPFISKKSRKFFVPIRPDYHTDLFPDSILNTESPLDFVENEPFRNAISKVYVSRSFNRDLRPGDILVFYRTGGYYKSVVTTLGIVEKVTTAIKDEKHFINLCRKRSVFSEEKLKDWWNERRNNRPFVVNFLYAYSFPKRLNLEHLIKIGVIRDIYSAPRGFERISEDSFYKIIEETGSNEYLIAN